MTRMEIAEKNRNLAFHLLNRSLTDRQKKGLYTHIIRVTDELPLEVKTTLTVFELRSVIIQIIDEGKLPF